MTTATKPDFEKVRLFFRSWGLIPDNEEQDMTQLNEMCYLRMRVDGVKLFGTLFKDYIDKECILEVGEYHIGPKKWSELEKDWQKFEAH